MTEGVYTLYGSHASYYTAKTRSYLRKKGIPFIERVPGVPRFRQYVRKMSNNHRIPQLETPEGDVLQDTTVIFDTLEARFPEPPAYPPGLRQQLAVRLFDVLLDLQLGRPAWHYRWNFMDENYSFVGREFGRSFRPDGNDQELEQYGALIAERMEGKRSGLGDSVELRRVLEAVYLDVLTILERQFQTYPYLFGGLPSIADHSLMGPMFGHLARDPVPALLMKQNAPRVYRWCEHMNTPEIASPELSDTPVAYLEGDEVPEATADLLSLCLKETGTPLLQSIEVFNNWLADQPTPQPGAWVSEKGHDEPTVGHFVWQWRGVDVADRANTHRLWILQRTQDWFDDLSEEEKSQCRQWLDELGGSELLETRPSRRLTRISNRIAFE